MVCNKQDPGYVCIFEGILEAHTFLKNLRWCVEPYHDQDSFCALIISSKSDSLPSVSQSVAPESSGYEDPAGPHIFQNFHYFMSATWLEC